jgi:cysteinyl-tRNA synthetase
MSLRIYNTLNRRKETFEPLENGHARMYVCGVTVYDECHVGHARSTIVFDVIYRYLLSLGHRVTYVRNFTDIDDKILDRAVKEGIPWDRISRTYIASFHRDMDALGVLRPTLEPLATEHIQDMIRAIQALEERGIAYAVNGNVYFAVNRFHDYGKLSHRDREQMMAGARIEVDKHKRDPLDFALWKSSQPAEPAWESPWGPGRPGWHIECSCMSQKYLGDTFDIHGGGLDLVFPHHENEIAQAEGLTEKPFARYWIHNGPLTREGTKMSKSLGNILSIQEALQHYHPEELRLFLLTGHYRNPLDLTTHGLEEAQVALDRLYTSLSRIDEVLGDDFSSQESFERDRQLQAHSREMLECVRTFRTRFRHAMDDDFNTALAIAHLFDLNRLLNQWLDHPRFAATHEDFEILKEARNCYTLYRDVMGLLAQIPTDFFRQKEETTLTKLGFTRDMIQALLDQRAKARREKKWEEADRIREDLLRKGIQVLDRPGGTTWKARPGCSNP